MNLSYRNSNSFMSAVEVIAFGMEWAKVAVSLRLRGENDVCKHTVHCWTTTTDRPCAVATSEERIKMKKKCIVPV
jgi:hypothetical protein